MRAPIVVFISCLFTNLCLCQVDVKQSLIVVHVDPSSKTQFKQMIFAYHFLNGAFTGRDELMSVMGRKDGKDYIRTDIGNNTIYQNRYLITGIGNIIDLKDKKILFDGRAALIRCKNDSAVFYTNDIFKGKFYSVYDFKNNRYEEVKDLLFKAKAGQDVEFDKTASPFKIAWYPLNKDKVTVTENAGYGQNGTRENHIPDPPLVWVDNTSFVYANFNKENTELSFYKVNIENKNNKLVGKIIVSPETIPGDMIKTPEGNLIMRLGARQILVDLKTQAVTEQKYTHPDNGFSYECSSKPAGRIVLRDNDEIGKMPFAPLNFKSSKGIVCVVKEIVVGPESYQQGIFVWSELNKNWYSVDAEDVLTLAGWVND